MGAPETTKYGTEPSPFEDEPRGYRSPEGTYEVILKSALEDTKLTDAEFRVLMYATTKPHEPLPWVFHHRKVAEELSWPEERARLALRGLTRHGYMALEVQRDEHGRIKGKVRTLRRELVVPIGYELPGSDVPAGQNHRVNNHRVAGYPLSEYVSSSEDGTSLLVIQEAESAPTPAANPAAGSSQSSEIDVKPDCHCKKAAVAVYHDEKGEAFGVCAGHRAKFGAANPYELVWEGASGD